MPTRTTITLEDDVASMLAALQQSQKTSFKKLANEALRRGLQQMNPHSEPRKPYRTPSTRGRPRIANIDNIGEVLALAEGEDYR